MMRLPILPTVTLLSGLCVSACAPADDDGDTVLRADAGPVVDAALTDAADLGEAPDAGDLPDAADLPDAIVEDAFIVDMAPDPDAAPPMVDHCATWEGIPAGRLMSEVHARLVRDYEPVRLANDRDRYNVARRWMYLNVERRNIAAGRGVQGLYTGFEYLTPADWLPDGDQVNTEHVMPRASLDPNRQSRRYEHQQSDIHNIYPTDPAVNEARGSTPFGEVARPDERFGPASIGDDNRGQTVFEPRAERKGDVARTLMYMAARWGLGLFGEELVIARAWHAMDPVDDWERARNAATARVQGNRNPFVDCPALVQQMPDFNAFAPIQEQLP